MTYAEAIKYLQSLLMFGARFGLQATRFLAESVGNPQNQLRFIHIAGTNGKGSTCAMLESIYRAAGLRVGLFTSPHLISFRERIQVNRQLISEADITRLVERTSKFTRQAETTFFEFVTVMALQHFAEQDCDLVIWETGLGGRLDATNIVTPLASVITNIGLDHQQWLGDTLAKIAAEKAGIIKPGVPVVTATDHPEALAVITDTASRMHAPLRIVGPHPAQDYSILLTGEHQRRNAALAVEVVGVLRSQIPVTQDAVQQGLASVHWPGRLQLIIRPGDRRILLDGAHNAAGAQALRTALQREPALNAFRPATTVLILGAMADKDLRAMCEWLAPLARRILVVPVASERSAAPVELAAACRTANAAADVLICSNITEALSRAGEEKFILITGSLYLVGEALAALNQSGAEPANETVLNNWQAAQPVR